MHSDKYGLQILDENDLCDYYLRNPDEVLKHALVTKKINFPEQLDLKNKPELVEYAPLDIAIEEFDRMYQNTWYMPEEYKTMDIAKWVLDQCKTDEELQRVGDELIKFQQRDMFILLRYCKYLVDTMRKHNIVWGVGRGSSVASYVLYLIGIHRINSIFYGLDIDEFLK